MEITKKNYLLYLLIILLVAFKIYYAWEIPFFNDEYVVMAKGFFDFLDLINYTLHNSYHPLLNFIQLYFFAKIGTNSELKIRLLPIIYIALANGYLVYLSQKLEWKKYLLPVLCLFNIYYFSFSMIITNYALALLLLILSTGETYLFYKDTRKFPPLLLFVLIQLTFFSNYFAGLNAFLFVFLVLIEKKAFKEFYIPFFKIFGVVFINAIFILQFSQAENYKYMILIFALSLLPFFILRQKDSLKIFLLFAPSTLWAFMRYFNHRLYIPVIGEKYMANEFVGIDFAEYLPMTFILITFLVSALIGLKDNKKFIGISSIIILLNILLYSYFAINNRQIYARYFIFIYPILHLTIAKILEKKENFLVWSILGLFIFGNAIGKVQKVSYLGIQDTRDIFRKITSNGKYSGTLIFFTKRYDHHAFYFKDYLIEKNFEFYTFTECNEESINKAFKIAGRNTFFATYEFECSQLKEKLKSLCDKSDDLCFDLKPKDAHVILKAFEPQKQPEVIEELRGKYEEI